MHGFSGSHQSALLATRIAHVRLKGDVCMPATEIRTGLNGSYATEYRLMLTLDEANRAIDAVLKHAHEQGYNVSVTVCDSLGHLIAHQRMDGAFLRSSHGSIGKAIAAAGLGLPSGEESDQDLRRSSVSLVLATGSPVIRRAGGLPIKRGEEVEGAIGVSGAPTNEQDEESARRGVEALHLSTKKPRDSSSSR
jgi:uncharacterized protein GlcG (DUF336 family)